MLREITLGQYYPVDSVIHKMDPRTKLFATVIYILSIFCFRGPIGFVAITAGLIAVIYLSKVPFSFMVRGLKAIVFILVFAGILNLFMTPGRELISIWKFTVTYEGAKSASLMLFRMIYLIIGTSVMTLTTTPNQLTDGLETALKPFAKIKVPVHEIAMMMSIALRFIPILVEETDKIMKAQMARGADFESGGIIKKVKSMVPLLVPLFVSAFRRANDLALAMEARCYHGGEGRTKMIPLHYEHRDKVAYVVVIVYIVLIFILRKFA
ncbi:MAG: energy-coupling factor transporter transmembrane protein EcfT [Lachnospiraceae bacterium]|nr:energy-coupling factor transporter transmembrane protein EcfT [Lachnospiraceae bacterium]